MERCVFTDEISLDFEEALRTCAAENMRAVQIRQVQAAGRNVVELPDDDIQRMRGLLRQYGIKVAGIGSPFGKCALTEQAYTEHLRLFDRAVRLAHIFDTHLIRVFAFYAPDRGASAPAPALSTLLPEIVERLRRPAEAARREGLTLMLENEYTTLIGSCAEARQVIDGVGSPALRLCWDVASGWYTGEPIFPDGYSQARGLISDVHVRDAGADPADPSRHGEVTRLGAGVIDWAAVIRQLSIDGYDGYCTLETHLFADDPLGAPKLQAATVHGMHELQRLMDAA